MSSQHDYQPRYLTRAGVAHYLSLKPRAVSRLVEAGTIPEPLRLSPGTFRWDRQAIDAVLSRSKHDIKSSADVDAIISMMKPPKARKHGKQA